MKQIGIVQLGRKAAAIVFTALVLGVMSMGLWLYFMFLSLPGQQVLLRFHRYGEYWLEVGMAMSFLMIGIVALALWLGNMMRMVRM